MELKTTQLRTKIDEMKKELSTSEKELENMVSSCRHNYGETIYDPVHTPAYTIPGDPPGTMGVDWRGPLHVPAQTEKRWKRVCELCGEIEYTTKVRKNIQEEPYWLNDGGKIR